MKGAEISATTASGEGGDITLFSSVLQLSNSNITATAGGTGNGGNIDIFTQVLTASDNSAITANAYEGQGGSIQINTRGYFISPNTRVEATSQKGINGTVEINFQQGNPTQSKAQPGAIAQQPQLATPCQSSSQAGSSFVNVGTGELPAHFDNQLDSSSAWQKNSTTPQTIDNSEQSKPSTTNRTTEIVEAQGWVVNAKGEIVLVAKVDSGTAYAEASSSTCHVQPATAKVSSGTKPGRD